MDALRITVGKSQNEGSQHEFFKGKSTLHEQEVKQKYDRQSQLNKEADLAAQESQVGKAETPSKKKRLGDECLDDSDEDEEQVDESQFAKLSSLKVKLLEKCGNDFGGNVDEMISAASTAGEALSLAEKNPVPDDAVGTDILARSSYTNNLNNRKQVSIAWVGEAWEQEAENAAPPMLTHKTWQEMIDDDDLISKVSRFN